MVAGAVSPTYLRPHLGRQSHAPFASRAQNTQITIMITMRYPTFLTSKLHVRTHQHQVTLRWFQAKAGSPTGLIGDQSDGALEVGASWR